MNERSRRGPIPCILFALLLWLGAPALAAAETPAPASPPAPASSTTPKDAVKTAPAPATPKNAPQPGPATPEPKPAAPSATPSPAPAAPVPVAPAPVTPGTPLAPGSAPRTDEIEPNASPQTPGRATSETIDVPSRSIVFVKGQSSYADAFKSIKASLATVRAAMDKAGLKATGHALTIFTDTDEKGFSYESAIPIAEPGKDAAGKDAPGKDAAGKEAAAKTDLGGGVFIGRSPAGSGLKFQHRGPFDEIDSTYDLIVSYLDEKGLQIDPPYIEEYLADPTTPDDPNLAVDIYVFVKK